MPADTAAALSNCKPPNVRLFAATGRKRAHIRRTVKGTQTMQKRMFAKYSGKCSRTGRPIAAGDQIVYDTDTRTAYIDDDEDEGRLSFTSSAGYRSDIFQIGGREFYRNKAGRCEDAPCCGCCTI